MSKTVYTQKVEKIKINNDNLKLHRVDNIHSTRINIFIKFH